MATTSVPPSLGVPSAGVLGVSAEADGAYVAGVWLEGACVAAGVGVAVDPPHAATSMAPDAISED